MCKKLFCLSIVVLISALAGDVWAADVLWDDGGGDHLWSTLENWDGDALPGGDGNRAIIDLADTTCELQSTQSVWKVVVGNGATADASFLDVQGTGDLSVDESFVLGYNSGAKGAMSMVAGSTANAGGTFYIGYGGNGVANMTGGTFTGDTDIHVGTLANMSSGELNISGGSVIVGHLFNLGHGANSSGELNISGGSVHSRHFYIGASGNGIVNMDGGSVTADDVLGLGISAGGSGTLNMSDGNIGIGFTFYIGHYGNGVVNMDGGNISAASIVSLGRHTDSIGELNISGGTVDIDNELWVAYNGDGTVNLTGGVLGCTDLVMRKAAGIGTMNITEGTLLLDGDDVSVIESYVAAGWLTGYGVADLDHVIVTYDAGENKTIVTAVLSVDGFESYVNTGDLLDTWKDGSVNGTGSSISLASDPNDPNCHQGVQAMRFDYDNDGPGPYYSEAELEFAEAQDWTDQVIDVKALDLWFRGSASNATEQMYVALEDADTTVAVVTSSPDLTSETWQAWRIDLQDFSGVDLTRVKKVYIGFGDRDSHPDPGGTGGVYIDDIGLYPARCFGGGSLVADLTGDCLVDVEDFAILARDWCKTSGNNLDNSSFENETLDSWYAWETNGAIAYDLGTGPQGTIVADSLCGNPSWGAEHHQNVPTGNTAIGICQVVRVVVGEDYTLTADWKGYIGLEHHWIEVGMFCITEAQATDMDLLRSEVIMDVFNVNPGNPIIVAKKDSWGLNNGDDPWDWQPITDSMGGGFTGAIGGNTVTATDEYLFISTKLGGASNVSDACFDNFVLQGPIPTDLDGDGTVDIGDFAVIAGSWLGDGLWP